MKLLSLGQLNKYKRNGCSIRDGYPPAFRLGKMYVYRRKLVITDANVDEVVSTGVGKKNAGWYLVRFFTIGVEWRQEMTKDDHIESHWSMLKTLGGSKNGVVWHPRRPVTVFVSYSSPG